MALFIGKGSITSLIISTQTEDEVLVVANEIGDKLMKYLRQEVEAVGSLGYLHGRRCIEVKNFSVIRGE